MVRIFARGIKTATGLTAMRDVRGATVASVATVATTLALLLTSATVFAGSSNSGLPQGPVIPSSDVLSSYTRSLYYFSIAPAVQRFSQVPSHAVGSSYQTPAEVAEAADCQSFYSKFTQTGAVKIHVSFGYYDDSTGSETIYNGTNFGMNASMDEAYLRMLRMVLTGSCNGQQGLCDFTDVGGDTFRKSVRDPLTGRTVEFVLHADNSSLTPYYITNTIDRGAEQNAKSQATREGFLNALQTDDAVFYFGHARNGGGPDFIPVNLLPNKHPNYRGFYETVRPGFHDMMSAIQARGAAPAVLGLYACYSEFWFGRALQAASPNTGYLFTQSDKLSGGDEHFAAGLAAMDSLVRFQCFDGMHAELEAARKDPNMRESVRNFLSRRSPVDVQAHIPSVPD